VDAGCAAKPKAPQAITTKTTRHHPYFESTLAAFFLLWELARNPGIFVVQGKGRAKPQTLQIHCNCSISLAIACVMCYTVAMKTSIQQAAARSLIHRAITAPTQTKAQILAQAAAALDPSVNPNKVQEIWLAKFSQTKKAGS